MTEISRLLLVFFLWIAVVQAIVRLIGPTRKERWFRQRELSRSFLNRRGLFGQTLLIGHPRTCQGWLIWAGIIGVIATSLWIALPPTIEGQL